jgi:mRNA interferase RelE/StbE
MEIIYTIEYAEVVARVDIPALPKTVRNRIRAAVETKLRTHPDLYGKPLRRSLHGYRKVRVGNYRVVFRIEKKKVKIFAIRHRKEVYEMAEVRVS